MRARFLMILYPSAVGFLAALPALGAVSSPSPSATPAGVTPRFLGFNNGHYRSTSNTSAWVDYASPNAMRVWAAANDYESSDDRAPFGDGVNSLASFDTRKAALRADLLINPDSSTYINWSSYNWSRNQTGRNHINLDYVLSQLHSRGVDVLLQTTRSNAAMYAIAGPTDYAGMWEQWQWYYTISFWAARNYDVQRYQMYNEPDLDDIPRPEYVLRLQLASDAIRSAIADVNTRFGKSLVADVHGPVAASTTGHLSTWGKDLLAANRTDYAGRPIAVDNVNTYDVHRYNSTGSSFAADQTTIHNYVLANNASGNDLPISYTEYNRYTAANYSSSANSLDVPAVYIDVAGIVPGAMSQNVKGMYAFKFNQTYWTSSSTGLTEPMKSGFYYVDDAAGASTSSTHNTTGSTKGAEVMRLANKAFEGQRPRYAINTNNSTNEAAGAFDADSRRYYYYSVNRATTAADVTLNLANWDVSPGQLVTVEEVSASHHGHVSRTYAVGPDKKLVFAQTPQSLFLLTIPSGAAQLTAELDAIADASVSLASPDTNNGTATAAFAARDAAGNGDDATYLKFSLAGTNKPTISRALLRLTGQNVANAGPTILHLYGLLTDTWSESAITWNSAPNLSAATDAKLTGVGVDAFPLGGLTYDNASHEYAVDVTDFVRRHPDSTLSFVLLREQRFAGDADASRIQFNTREAAGGRPKLSLSLYPNPVFNWRLNGNGSLNAAANLDVGSTPNSPGSILNLGQFITSPHTVSVTSPTTLGSLNFNNLNSYHLTGPATITLDNDGVAPSIAVHQGAHKLSVPLTFTLPANLTLAAGASLDTTTTPLTLANPAAAIRQYLLTDQLTSSSSDPGHRLAYLTTAGTTLIRLALTGDANLDGRLDADDFALLDKGFLTAGSFWWEGDFNYDGTVNGADYLLIDQNFLGQGHALSPTFLSLRESQFGPAYVAQLLAFVPEPASVITSLVGLTPLLTRRRRCN